MLGKQTEITGLRNWTHVLSGSFSPGSYDKNLNPDGDLFFYDYWTGDAETVKVGANGKLTTIGKFTGLARLTVPVVFTYQNSLGGIMLYGPKTGAHLYDATLGKMTFLKTIPTLGLPSSNIIRGGETNYIRATVSLYVSLYNIFVSLLSILGFASRD